MPGWLHDESSNTDMDSKLYWLWHVHIYPTAYQTEQLVFDGHVRRMSRGHGQDNMKNVWRKIARPSASLKRRALKTDDNVPVLLATLLIRHFHLFARIKCLGRCYL